MFCSCPTNCNHCWSLLTFIKVKDNLTKQQKVFFCLFTIPLEVMFHFSVIFLLRNLNLAFQQRILDIWSWDQVLNHYNNTATISHTSIRLLVKMTIQIRPRPNMKIISTNSLFQNFSNTYIVKYVYSLKAPIHNQFYCQLFHIALSYWWCMGDIDAKILYKTIDTNYIASIKLNVYGPLKTYGIMLQGSYFSFQCSNLLPIHVMPLPLYPTGQVQSKLPRVFVHSALGWHPKDLNSHSFQSEQYVPLPCQPEEHLHS